jgi:hypothetical protein
MGADVTWSGRITSGPITGPEQIPDSFECVDGGFKYIGFESLGIVIVLSRWVCTNGGIAAPPSEETVAGVGKIVESVAGVAWSD